MDIEFSDFSEDSAGTRYMIQSPWSNFTVEQKSSVASPSRSRSRSPPPVREAAVASAPASKLCVDRKILTNYRTIGFASDPAQRIIYLMVAPEGTLFGEGRSKRPTVSPGPNDPIMPRVYFVLLDDITLELCQFDVSFTLVIESYACSCRARTDQMCVKRASRMRFVADAKPHEAPRCLFYKADPASPPSVRVWYPQDADQNLTHHRTRGQYRYVFDGATDVPYYGYDDDDDDADTSGNNNGSGFVTSQSQEKYAKLRTRIRAHPITSAHTMCARLDTSIFYERASDRIVHVTLQRKTNLRQTHTNEAQSLLLYSSMERMFGSNERTISIATVKMDVARRVARLLDCGYEYDPRWQCSAGKRRKGITIDDDDDNEAKPRSGKHRVQRVPIAFVMAFGFWGNHADLGQLPSKEPPALEWPSGCNRPSYQFGFVSSETIAKALTEFHGCSTVNPMTIGVARNPSAVSDCILKFARRCDRRLPYLYAGRLDAAAAADRRKIAKLCRHYGFSVAIATHPFRDSDMGVKDRLDKVRFMRLVATLLELAAHSLPSASFSYDRLLDVDARNEKCNVSHATPRRVASKVAGACAIAVLPGVDPRERGVVATYVSIVQFFRAYVNIRDTSDSTRATTTVQARPGQLTIEHIPVKRTVFSGHTAIMELFSRHFRWNSADRREFESVLVRMGVVLDAIAKCKLHRFDAVSAITIGTKQVRDAFSALSLEIPVTFFDPERAATSENAVKTCIPPEIVRTGVRFAWSNSERIADAVSPGAETNARFFYLYDETAWKTRRAIIDSLPGRLREFNISFSASMLSYVSPTRKNEDALVDELLKRITSMETAGHYMVIVPDVLGTEYVKKLRAQVRTTYGTSIEPDEIDTFFMDGKFIVQSHDIKDSLASSPMMKNSNIILFAAHLLGQREFLDIFKKVVYETTSLRITDVESSTLRPLVIYLHGFIHGHAPGQMSALPLLTEGELNLADGNSQEIPHEAIMQLLCDCKIMWVPSGNDDIELPPLKKAKISRPLYVDTDPIRDAVQSSLVNAAVTVIATSDPYVSSKILDVVSAALDRSMQRVYIDAFVKVNQYGRPFLPYGEGSLFDAKQANEKFWTNAQFIPSANNFPGTNYVNYCTSTNIVVSINRLALEYSCTNQRQLLWLLSRARVVILTNATKQNQRFDNVASPVSNEKLMFKPYVACSSVKRAFSDNMILLNDGSPGSVERYIVDLFTALG